MRNILVRSLLPGGIVAPLDMLEITHAAKLLGNKFVLFGSRQDILFHPNDNTEYDINNVCVGLPTEYEWDSRATQNIVSSYAAADIQASTDWMHSGTYLYVLDTFNYKPLLRINIVDPVQKLVPMFSGNLNFLASRYEKYWFLYIRLPKWKKTILWPALIDGSDIADVSKYIEQYAFHSTTENVDSLFAMVNETVKPKNRVIDYELEFDTSFFTHYEGIHPMEDSQHYWAGFYWRNNNYDISFLEALSKLCMETGIAKICLTPWKSFLVKDIQKQDLLKWEKLIGEYGITMRHSSLELNWHLPAMDTDALAIKQRIVRELDRQDIRVEGITFAVHKGGSNPFTMVLIEPHKQSAFAKLLGLKRTFSVHCSVGFNPNCQAYTCFEDEVFQDQLPETISRISKQYYRELAETQGVIEKEKEVKDARKFVYQCRHCLSIYDSTIGDPELGIEPRTQFDQLPEAYYCPLCESPKRDFVHVPLSNVYA